MSDKSELKAELERKKQRLAQIREEKKRKEEEKKKKESDQKKDAPPPQEESDLEKKRREAEALLQSMGITPEPPLVPPPTSPSSKSVSTPSEAGSQDSGDGTTGARTLHWDTDPSVLQLHSDSDLGRGPLKLGMAKITQVDFPPRETVTYTKETQTPVVTHENEGDDDEEETVAPKQSAASEEEKPAKKEEKSELPPHELTEEEKQQIVHTEEFISFIDHSTRIVERALSEQVNIFFDYSGRDLEEKEGEIQAGAKLSLNRQFFDERWSKHRVVSCLDWSSQVLSDYISVSASTFGPYMFRHHLHHQLTTLRRNNGLHQSKKCLDIIVPIGGAFMTSGHWANIPQDIICTTVGNMDGFESTSVIYQ